MRRGNNLKLRTKKENEKSTGKKSFRKVTAELTWGDAEKKKTYLWKREGRLTRKMKLERIGAGGEKISARNFCRSSGGESQN